jgi:hypothetical protein
MPGVGEASTDRWLLNRWWVIAAVGLLCTIPLLWPTNPPLVDVPGHIGRFRIELDLNSTPDLQRYFRFKWYLIGNLGTDLLIVPLQHIFGLELGVKLIIIAIPVLTVIGIFLVVIEIHGTVPPTTLFAVPFVYGYPFNFGFMNFCLSMALALLAFAYWLRLSRLSKWRLRAMVFVPISCLLWLVHAFGWGALGLLAWSSELVRLRANGNGWLKSASFAGLNCLPLSIPLGLMVLWRSGQVAGITGGYLNIPSKTFSLAAALRDRWLVWDSMSVAVAVVLIGSAIFDKHLELSRRLSIPAAVLAVIFLLLPTTVFGSAYADMRLGPFMLIVAIAAIRLRTGAAPEVARRVLVLGLVFMAARLAGNTISFAFADKEMQSELEALNHIPNHARVLSLVGDSCGSEWPMPRYDHLGSFVITRKLGFSNDQWQLPGAQLLTVIYAPAREFGADPSELTYTRKCQNKSLPKIAKGETVGRTADQALRLFPREAFDFVWLIHPSGFTRKPRQGLDLIWSGSDSQLYKINHQKPALTDEEATPI